MASLESIPAAEVELLEAQAWAELHGQFGLDKGTEFAVVRRWGRSTALASQIVNAVAINRAVGFGFERPFEKGQLAQVRDFFRQRTALAQSVRALNTPSE